MCRKKILFFPQNNEHVLNMLKMEEELIKRDVQCFYVDTSEIYHQKLVIESKNVVKIDICKWPERSFYSLNTLDRIKCIINLRSFIKKLAETFDLFVFGNDGAIQRLLNYYAKKKNKPTVVVLDGMISNYSYSLKDVFLYSKDNRLKDFKDYFKYNINKNISVFLAGSVLSPYFPSIIGSSNVDRIYTIGKHSKFVLDRYRHRKTKVLSFGLPRMANYFIGEESQIRQKNSICYITSAFKWHGKYNYDKYQHQDIQLILKALNELNANMKVYIKIHPREDKTDYEKYEKFHNVEIVENEAMEKSLDKYNIFFSNISTAIMEGAIMGIKVYSVMINFPFWKVKRSFIGSNEIEKVFNYQEMKEILKTEGLRLQNGEYPQGSEFVSNKTKESASLISNDILRLCEIAE